MNAIRATRALNQRELDQAVPPSASWHADYRDTAYVYIGGLPLDLSEGDVVTIFSQYGNPTHLNLVREKETGKSRGFAFLKYEDQRSCDLAVDNLGGAEVLGRMLRVDHSRYKKKEGEDEDTWRIDRLEGLDKAGGKKRASDTESEERSGEEGKERKRKKRKVLKEEKELEKMLVIKQDGEEEDPMRDYLIKEKMEEVEKARSRQESEKKHRHRHKHRHRDRNGDDDRDRNDKNDRHGSRQQYGEDENNDKERLTGHRDKRYNRDTDSQEQGSRRHHDRDHSEGPSNTNRARDKYKERDNRGNDGRYDRDVRDREDTRYPYDRRERSSERRYKSKRDRSQNSERDVHERKTTDRRRGNPDTSEKNSRARRRVYDDDDDIR